MYFTLCEYNLMCDCIPNHCYFFINQIVVYKLGLPCMWKLRTITNHEKLNWYDLKTDKLIFFFFFFF